LSILYGRHAGETIIVVGNSSSLNEQNLDLMDAFTTLGLNRILAFYEPTYYMAVDQSVMRDEHERINETTATRLFYHGLMNSKNRILCPGPWVSTGPMTGQADPRAKTGPIHICRGGGNSAYEAVQIAMRMGAVRIALAGVDMYWPPGHPSHCFGSGAAVGCKLPYPDKKIEDFALLKKQYARGGIEMCSVSPWDTPFRKVMGYTPLEDL